MFFSPRYFCCCISLRNGAIFMTAALVANYFRDAIQTLLLSNRGWLPQRIQALGLSNQGWMAQSIIAFSIDLALLLGAAVFLVGTAKRKLRVVRLLPIYVLVQALVGTSSGVVSIIAVVTRTNQECREQTEDPCTTTLLVIFFVMILPILAVADLSVSFLTAFTYQQIHFYFVAKAYAIQLKEETELISLKPNVTCGDTSLNSSAY
ncbi:hypothetical protein DSO57_1002355 [Entomophthora muscae]|uniref:Uncharacterized protein n=1 Tax=Entomophthora muscae TaxID=34485 RepID=A0ACC2UUK0_9FUNG|nr:hypothetical protein DSO57_1002355 [Entomophthora muscae]